MFIAAEDILVFHLSCRYFYWVFFGNIACHFIFWEYQFDLWIMKTKALAQLSTAKNKIWIFKKFEGFLHDYCFPLGFCKEMWAFFSGLAEPIVVKKSMSQYLLYIRTVPRFILSWSTFFHFSAKKFGTWWLTGASWIHWKICTVLGA